MPFTKLSFDGDLATLTLDHPDGNRINFAMRIEIRDAMNEIGKSAARALLVRGAGPDFCLGGDVREWPDLPTAQLRAKIEVFAHALDRLRRLAIPTLAAVQGACMGGGFELALSCDMIVAARSSRFGCPEAALGIATLQGGMLQIVERIGRARAAEIIFLAEPVAAEQMEHWDVVNRVVDDNGLEREAEALARRLAAGPTQVYAATKALWQLQADDGEAAARAKLYDISMPLFDTRDARTALRNAAEAVRAGEPFPKPSFIGE